MIKGLDNQTQVYKNVCLIIKSLDTRVQKLHYKINQYPQKSLICYLGHTSYFVHVRNRTSTPTRVRESRNVWHPLVDWGVSSDYRLRHVTRLWARPVIRYWSVSGPCWWTTSPVKNGTGEPLHRLEPVPSIQRTHIQLNMSSEVRV